MAHGFWIANGIFLLFHFNVILIREKDITYIAFNIS